MDTDSLKNSIAQYKEQLKQINIAISAATEGQEKNDLINLKADIEQLIELTEENLETICPQNEQPSTSGVQNVLDDEYALFMQEMEKEGAVEQASNTDITDDLKSLEGMKCQAPHVHSWGDTVFHNAMVCSVASSGEEKQFNEIKVRVMFTNPTHQEMLPCPYFLDGNCKFTEDRCNFSHGEIISLSDLQEYKEPNFKNVKIGSKVLAKKSNRLWHRAIVKQNSDNECTIKFESNQEEHILPLHDVMPLETDINSELSSSSDSDSEIGDQDNDWLIQKSLLTTPASEKLGDWERHTKGIGSKLMQQMGYVLGTGLGRYSDGRLEPVQAVILPSGKSLDHCMTLRENAGGDENLFNVERRLKKLQKQQEIRSKKAYEREKQKKDVFEFLNDTLILSKNKVCNKNVKGKHKQGLKAETNRDLNVASLKIEEDIKKVEMDLFKIKESLIRHNNPETTMNKSLKTKLINKEDELKRLHNYSKNVKNEQNLRKDHKKLTVF